MFHKAKPIVLILVLTTLLRVLFLGTADINDDEALNAVRAVGPYDYMESYTSLSPVQTLSEKQWWQQLSFHDHPPLVFWLEHISMKLFGQNPWGVRIPGMLAGIVSVYLVYLISRRLINEQFGLLAALAITVSNAAVWSSRNAFLESVELCFMLLALYALLRTFKNQKWWLVVGLAVGLALLSKYFAVVILPVILVITLIYNRKAFKTPWLYAGAVLGIAVLTPVIIYNFQLFHATGAFDAALSSMLGMHPEIYASHADRSVMLSLGQIMTIPYGFHWVEIILAVVGLGFLVYRARKNEPLRLALRVIGSYTLAVLVIYLLVSPARKQFLVLAVPVFAWGMAYVLYMVWERYADQNKKISYVIFSILFVLFGAVTINTQFFARPAGAQGVTYLGLRNGSYEYSYLERWLEEFYEEHNLRFSVYGNEPQITSYQDQLYEAHKEEWSLSSDEHELIVYSGSLNYSSVRWLFIRRKLYEIRPMVGIDNFKEKLLPNIASNEQLTNLFNTFYFIYPAPEQQNGELYFGKLSPRSAEVVTVLVNNQVKPEIVKDGDGKELFWIFKVDAQKFVENQ